MVEIGEKIIEVARQQGKTIPQIAKHLNISSAALYRILKRKDLKITRILQFSQILNHDFLQYYQPQKTSDLQTLHTLQTENKQLKEKLQILQRENNLLNDFVQVLKSQKH